MQCRICNNEADNLKYEARESMFGSRDVFDYFQCSKCGCLQIAEFPWDLSKYYGDDYYSYQVKQKQNKARRLLIRMRNHYAVFNRGVLGKLIYDKNPATPSARALRSLYFLRPTRDMHILEVGCGSGILLQSLCELGFRNLLGADPFIDKDIEYGNGLTIRKLYIEEIQGKWDVVMFHHSFEHVPNPRETLQSAGRLLNSGGYCMIRIPTVSSYAWKHYGVDWIQLDAPRHFFLHSCESMGILAGETGLELVDMVYDSTGFQFWGSEQLKRGMSLMDERSYGRNPENSVFSGEEIAGFTRRAEEMNAAGQGDQAVFYLRKP
ncbi:MAG: class I SAM-dependent methyltransferase [Burkholderiales bacterium]|nr:class I SAM-dependent methyltransferase [Burkholderiales bacterium]